MKRFDSFTFRLMLLGFVLAFLTCGGRASADFVVGAPTNLGPTVNSGASEFDSTLSPDGLSLFFGSDRSGGVGKVDMWVTTRPTTDEPWGTPVNLGPIVNSPYDETDPALSTDGLVLYFTSYRPGGYGRADFWITTRPTTAHPWGPPVNLGPPVNSEFNESDPSLSPDSLALYFCDWGYPQTQPRPGGYGNCDILVAIRNTTDEAWGTPTNLGPLVNEDGAEWSPDISADNLVLLFTSSRSGGLGRTDTWLTRRRSISEPWSVPINMGPGVNSPYTDTDPDLSADDRFLFFSSDRPGGSGNDDLWQVSIEPIVDLNGDEVVDAADMCIMVDHWGENYSLCDIGPTPLGDGIVDVEDLKVLAEHLFEDYRLVAHWALDEEMGNVAYDSVGDNYGTVQGKPLWQPTEGKINGALQFDGIDDCVVTGSTLNPADGEFSIFVWVKGSVSGQAIISQVGSANWLCTDSVEGCLMTELKCPGRSGGPLLSQKVITDGNWHKIGFVWDGSYRHLYVDGVEVANDDAQLSGLVSADSGLFFGTGCSRSPGTFFSGLIDDVRIYNRAVHP